MSRTNKTIINLEIFQNKDFIDRPNDANKIAQDGNPNGKGK